MKKSVMKRWVKALRSGKYEQGVCFLSKDGKYCCLGVLCEVLNVPKDTLADGTTAYDKNTEGLPESALASAEMNSGPTGLLPKAYKAGGVYYRYLTKLNDMGLSFKQIANIIERNYKDL